MQVPQVNYKHVGTASRALEALAAAGPSVIEAVDRTYKTGLEHSVAILTSATGTNNKHHVLVSDIIKGDIDSVRIQENNKALWYIHTHPSCLQPNTRIPSQRDLAIHLAYQLQDDSNAYSVVINCEAHHPTVCTYLSLPDAHAPTNNEWIAPANEAGINHTANERARIAFLKDGKKNYAFNTAIMQHMRLWGFPSVLRTFSNDLTPAFGLPNKEDLLKQRIQAETYW